MNISKNKVVFSLLTCVLLLCCCNYPNQQGKPVSSSHQTMINPSAPLIYTKHARCRMECRHISEADIREVLREGYINDAKSKPGDLPCPTYAIEEKRHRDGVRLRIVFARCDGGIKVVTCIDRDDEFACNCK